MGSRKREVVHRYFEYYCEIAPPSSQTSEPTIVYKFPTSSENDDLVKSAVKFVFPFEFERNLIQHFSFVLTDADAKFTYGYCRHDPHVDNATVFLSYIENHDEFYKYLDVIASRNGSDPADLATPSREYEGETFQLNHYLRDIRATAVDNYIPHELPRIPGNRNLTDYFDAVDSRAMVGMLGALLHERRIIVKSKNPTRLSACVQAANDLLYPLVWQHIFIPILPESLVDYLSAPMPFLIGVSEAMYSWLSPLEIGEVVLLDADRSIFITPFDDLSLLPVDMQFSLHRSIKLPEPGEDTVSRAFLKTIVQIIGGYKASIKYNEGNLIFDGDLFVRGSKNSTRNFRKQLLMTQKFQQFIDERLARIVDGNTHSDEFEYEYAIWESAQNLSGGKRLSAAVDTAVESVRQGGREVMQAIQSKLRMKKNTTRPSSRLSENVDFDALNTFQMLDFPGTSSNPDVTQSLDVQGASSDSLTHSLDFATIFTQNSPNSSLGLSCGSSPLRLSPQPVPMPSREASNLTRDDDQSTPARQRDTDLLRKYGIEFDKLKISRDDHHFD